MAALPVLNESQLALLRLHQFSRVLQFSAVSSTNSVLKAEAVAGAPGGLVAVADYQTAGRGRFGRQWESPPGASLLFSLLLRPSLDDLPPPRRHLAVAAVSLAVMRAAQSVAGAHLGLKWPNDLVASTPARQWRAEGDHANDEDLKVAGVLAETVATSSDAAAGLAPAATGVAPAASGPALVVGVGVNVRWAPGEGPTRPGQGGLLKATCLERLAGRTIDRGDLLVETLVVLEGLWGRWGTVAEAYRQACATIGREVIVTSGHDDGRSPGRDRALHGTAVEVDDDGCLVLRGRDGRLARVAAGDVVHARHAGPAPRAGRAKAPNGS